VTEALLVSNGLLWLLVVVLGLVVLALTRQVGVLHERLAPVGALASQRGPEVGEAAPELALADLAGGVVRIGGVNEASERTLLFFLSPTCPVCETLLPTLRRAAREEPNVRVVFASDGEPAEHVAFARERGLDPASYVVSMELGVRFQVAKLPYAVLIDDEGIVRSKGIVNTREHIDSLFEAHAHGVASIQAYLAREQGRTPLAGAEGVR
jgi:methylamine dehydrogenase accessory protein MauD